MFRNLLKIAAATIVVAGALGAQVAAAGTSALQLTYHGDWVQTNPKVYILFWGNWNNGDPYGAKNYLIRFYQGLGGSSYSQILTQYSMNCKTTKLNCNGNQPVTNPTSIYGNWYYDANIPAHPTKQQIAAEVNRFEKAVAHDYGSDVALAASTQYVIALPNGHTDTHSTKNQACGWHNYTTVAGDDVTYTVLPYQNIRGCDTTPNHLDAFSITAGHEFAESVTDPFLASWFSAKGDEIADLCEDDPYDYIQLRTGTFAVQPIWSQAAYRATGKGCVLSA
jgi:serine protease